MEYQLPTKQQLKQLAEDKGSDVLVWYAWRNALRALPLLGKISLVKLWPKDTLKYTIAICRISLLLANYHRSKYSAKSVSLDAAAAANNAADNAAVYANTYSPTYSAYYSAAAYSTYSAYSAYSTYSIYDFYTDESAISVVTDTIITDTFDAAAYTTYAYASAAGAASAYADYQFLLQLNKPVSDYWFSQPLWNSNRPIAFEKNCYALSNKLKKIGLGFMATDLNLLWQEEVNPVQPHWKNYIKHLSTENLKSPDSFKAVILGHSAKINAVRVLLLGSGGAGKTTLAHRLQSQNIPEQPIIHKATIGIDYLDHQPLDLHSKISAFIDLTIPNALQLYLWDFGGQTLFYGLHKSFLHENCVYVLVVDNRHEQAPDEWLQQINHLVGHTQNLPILIVSNEYENCQKQQNEQRLKREYSQFNLKFFYFSCFNANENYDYNYYISNKLGKGLLDFKQQLLKTAANSRYFIAQSLLDAAEDIDHIFLKKAVVEGLELEDKLEKYLKKDTTFDILMDQLEGLGRAINITKLTVGDRYCLNPAWVVDHAYHLLYLDSLKNSQGTISYKELKREAWQYFAKLQKEKQKKQNALPTVKLKPSNIDDLLNFLQQSRVCKALQNKQLLFFPDLAAANEPKQVQYDLRKQEKLLGVFEFHLPYLPISLAAHLVCRWLENSIHPKVLIESIKDVWCEGFILRHQHNTDHFLIVQYQSRKAVLLVHCFAQDAFLSDLLEAIWHGLIEEIHPIPAEQLLLFVGIKQGMSALRQDRPTSITQNTPQALANYQEFLTLLRKIEAKMGTNNTINIMDSTFRDSPVGGIGDHTNMTQNAASNETITYDNQAEIALRAIQSFQQEKTLTTQQDIQLLQLKLKIEEENMDDTLYQRLGIHIGTVANLATISSAIAASLGWV